MTRNEILTEWHSRLWQITGIQAVFRNPKRVPDDLDYPLAAFFAASDVIIDSSNRGGMPSLVRELPISTELYVNGTSEEEAPGELEALLLLAKTEIYRGSQPNLGGKAMLLIEGTTGDYLVPEIDNVMGIAIEFTVKYVENVANLFT